MVWDHYVDNVNIKEDSTLSYDPWHINKDITIVTTTYNIGNTSRERDGFRQLPGEVKTIHEA